MTRDGSVRSFGFAALTRVVLVVTFFLAFTFFQVVTFFAAAFFLVVVFFGVCFVPLPRLFLALIAASSRRSGRRHDRTRVGTHARRVAGLYSLLASTVNNDGRWTPRREIPRNALLLHT